MRCGWCGRINVAAGEKHTVPQSAYGGTVGRGGNPVCQGYKTYVAIAHARTLADQNGSPREIRG